MGLGIPDKACVIGAVKTAASPLIWLFAIQDFILNSRSQEELLIFEISDLSLALGALDQI